MKKIFENMELRHFVVRKKTWRMILSLVFWVSVLVVVIGGTALLRENVPEGPLSVVQILWLGRTYTILDMVFLIYIVLGIKIITSVFGGVLNSFLNLAFILFMILSFQSTSFFGGRFGILTLDIVIPAEELAGLSLQLYIQSLGVWLLLFFIYLGYFIFDLYLCLFTIRSEPCIHNTFKPWDDLDHQWLKEKGCLLDTESND